MPIIVDEEFCKALYKAAESSICIMEYGYGLRLYREYLSRCPEIPGAWHGLAICLEATGNREDARRAYERALELNLRYGNASNLLWAGWCAFKLGKYELAYRLFRQSAEKDPNYAYTWHSLAIAAYKIGRRDEGEEAMRRYRAMVKERPYERRECEGIRMLIEALESLRRFQDKYPELIKVAEDLLTRAVNRNRSICNMIGFINAGNSQ